MSKKAAVIGMGISGKGACSFLLQKGFSVLAIDKKHQELLNDSEIGALISQGIELKGEDVDLKGISLLVVSPGVASNHFLIEKAKSEGVDIVGEIELAFRYLQNRCIGVTGSNGKTTTSLLITHLLNQAGQKARALGNVGSSLCQYLLNPDPEEILVIELSSFQLETIRESRLDFALILNLMPNHLDRHVTMQAYAEAKFSIRKRLKPEGRLFISSDLANQYGSLFGNFEIYDVKRDNNLDANIQAALKVVTAFGFNEQQLLSFLSSFKKPPHRIEWVADINGVSYYNDSKSSNVDSVIYALKQIEASIVLIVGGTDKGSSYLPWLKAFQGKVKKVVAYGTAADKIQKDLGSSFGFEKRHLFKDAVLRAVEFAEVKDCVVLSPGCSSYDQFRNFEHRGDVFKQIVNELADQRS